MGDLVIQDDPALVFALTVKRWFATNDWPQKITDDWAKDPGVLNPHGPWASQVCGALKADGYNPKAQFFLALAEFNQFVARQELKSIVGKKRRERLEGAVPLLTDAGTPYTGSDFWSLFAGLINPPEQFQGTQELTQEDVDVWTKAMRDNFRKVSLKYMVSPTEAWDKIEHLMIEITGAAGDTLAPDDFDWAKEVLCGLRNPTVDEAIRRAKRSQHSYPLQTAMEQLLGAEESKKLLLTA